MGACGRLQERLYSCLTNELSSSTVSWLRDFPVPHRYLTDEDMKPVRKQIPTLYLTGGVAELLGHLVCFLPFSSCCATEAHFSASCRTRRRLRSRSLSGNSLDSDSVRRERNVGRPEARRPVHHSLTLNMRHTSSNGRFDLFRPGFIDVYLSSFPVWPPESR